MSDVDLGRYARVIWRWLWLIVLAVGIASVVSFYASTLLPKLYLSSVTLLVGEETTSPKVSAEDIGVSQRAAVIFAGMARRQPVLQATVDALRLPLNWRELQTRVVVIRPEGSQFLEIRVTDTEPERAQAIASELARQLTLQSPTAQDLRQLEQRREFIREQLDRLQSDIQQAEALVAEKQAALKTEISARGVLDLQDEIRALDTKLTTWRNAYALFLSSIDTKKPNTLSVIEPAFTAGDPVSPNVPANVMLAATLGLLVALGAILLIEYKVNSDALRTAGEVRLAFGTAPLAALPDLGRRTSPEATLAAARDPGSEMAEACRVLRTSIQFEYGEGVLLVTSPGLGEGKSMTSASLGVSFAQAGKRAVLVDADLRNPSLHRFFGLPNERGLTSLVLGEPPLEGQAFETKAGAQHAIRPSIQACLLGTEVPGLTLLSTGPTSAVHPGDLLASAEMRSVVKTLLSAADVVVVDCPPVLPVADTAILASIGGAVLLVAEAGRTRGRALAHAKELLHRAHLRVLGVALNRVVKGTVSYRDYAHNSESDLASGKAGRTRSASAGADFAAEGPR
jgi:capsular exopolysaccharide synthesis family protein